MVPMVLTSSSNGFIGSGDFSGCVTVASCHTDLYVTEHENRAYVHKIHLFVLWYISPLVQDIKHYIPHELLHKWWEYY